MSHYVDIHILPNPDFEDTLLMSMLFSCVHKSLVRSSCREIGVSFPYHGKTLGNLLRLHGSFLSITKLIEEDWLGRIRDYVSLSSISAVPRDITTYRVVKRVQCKSNIDRLLRRSLRKGWITEEEAHQKQINSINKKINFPYVRLKSLSTGQEFSLFIEHGEIIGNQVPGSYSAYGLSSIATIPWF